ncbi:MAG: iron-containing alcohol dehydrogenase, partial [Victivallaceae bacterium]
MVIHQNILDGYPDTTVAFGNDAFLSFEYLMRKLGAKKIVVFTGRHSADATGIWRRFLASCKFLNLSIARFSDIAAEPDTETVERMIQFLQVERPDEIIAIGGGSAMDAAKAAYLVYQAGGTIYDYFGTNKYSDAQPARKIKKVI